jgi:hypothetical protein
VIYQSSDDETSTIKTNFRNGDGMLSSARDSPLALKLVFHGIRIHLVNIFSVILRVLSSELRYIFRVFLFFALLFLFFFIMSFFSTIRLFLFLFLSSY